MQIHSSELIKSVMPSGLKQSEHEQAVSLLPDPTSGTKGNDFSDTSSAAADFGEAVLSVADRMQSSHKQAIPRVTRNDLNWQKPGRHGLTVLLKNKNAFHEGTAEIQEDSQSLFERMTSNITAFLQYRYWDQELIEKYLAYGGLSSLIILIHRLLCHILTFVLRLVDA